MALPMAALAAGSASHLARKRESERASRSAIPSRPPQGRAPRVLRAHASPRRDRWGPQGTASAVSEGPRSPVCARPAPRAEP
eukprot:scaffold3661_cov403-Prasinococcus_capsulatus_cf.AAC.6